MMMPINHKYSIGAIAIIALIVQFSYCYWYFTGIFLAI